ncbi:hypothetical protein D5085_15375 [Ectothiorhodospiraceae bacterium BW-2]|nr:hypothetical protein D5085_15375 [Ectothiorhodospiraceae bacterium BW-2]
MISATQLQAVSEQLQQRGLSEATLSELRQQFSEIHFTYCSDDDITIETAALSHPTFNLYLVDSRNHCLNLTTDSEVATGIVVAEVEQE